MSKGKPQYVFIRDPAFAWLPAIKEGSDSKNAQVKVPQYRDEQAIVCDGGKTAKGWEDDEVPLSEYNKGVLPMQNVNPSGELKAFPDMVNLPFLHEVCCPIRIADPCCDIFPSTHAVSLLTNSLYYYRLVFSTI